MRRRLVLHLGLAVACATVQAGTGPRPAARLAWARDGSRRAGDARTVDLVNAELWPTGWVLGQNYVIEFRFAGCDASRYPALAGELVATQPGVLCGIETAARAFVAHTHMAVVMVTSIDPVGAGLVKTLALPGTNATGMSGVTDQIEAEGRAAGELVPASRRFRHAHRSSLAERSARRTRQRGLARQGACADGRACGRRQGIRDAFARFVNDAAGGVLQSIPSRLRLGREVRAEVLRGGAGQGRSGLVGGDRLSEVLEFLAALAAADDLELVPGAPAPCRAASPVGHTDVLVRALVVPGPAAARWS